MRFKSWSLGTKIVSAGMGAMMAGGAAFAATNWIVGVAPGSAAESQAAGISNLTISAVASPSATNLLYPGGNGDVVMTISNPNPYPVTITGLQLPTNTTYAAGYSDSALSSANTNCTGANSDVIWNYSTSSTGSSHTLTTPLTVAAKSGGTNGSLVVTFTNDVSMTTSAPAACASTYFSMPSLSGITASGGAATATTSPTTDTWTS